MSEEKDTKVRLLESARQEFMEKGYMQASLRKICKNAGVTTGALYFFFQDKEDLFAALVEEPLRKLYEVTGKHFAAELAESEAQGTGGENLDDYKAAAMIVHYLYQYYDEVMLILTKSQGSRFEKCVDQFVEISEKHYRTLADAEMARRNLPPLEDYFIHWMSHMTIDLFVHLLTHESLEQAALLHVKPIVKFLLDGWKGIFQ